MITATSIYDRFIREAHELAISLTEDLPPVPDTSCECGSTNFQWIELNYERSCRLEIQQNRLFAFPDGFSDYNDMASVPYVSCAECDKAYNVSQQLLSIEWL